MLIRPSGIMPDGLFCKGSSPQKPISFALFEAKASTRDDPKVAIRRNVFAFLLNVKTRVTGFRNDYEAFLVCSRFHDITHVACSVLGVECCKSTQAGSKETLSVTCDDILAEASEGDPLVRIKSLLRLNDSLGEMRDPYLASLVRQEAKKSGMLALLAEGVDIGSPRDVDDFLDEQANNLGLKSSWDSARELSANPLEIEDEMVDHALKRYKSHFTIE